MVIRFVLGAGIGSSWKLCAKIKEIASCGTILCHNRRFARKWHRVFNPGEGGALVHQVRTGAAFGTSVPKSMISLPVAQFCAIIGVLPENGTEILIRTPAGPRIPEGGPLFLALKPEVRTTYNKRPGASRMVSLSTGPA